MDPFQALIDFLNLMINIINVILAFLNPTPPV
jgi:hypothetical protein